MMHTEAVKYKSFAGRSKMELPNNAKVLPLVELTSCDAG
jgi:hypothetical protein